MSSSLYRERELIVHDLLADKAPIMSLPFALDINLSPVTAIELCSNCPQDFMAKLQSFQTKIVDYSNSTRHWLLNGGGWGNTGSKASNDLVLTGHLDGSVCFWHCSSASMTFLFTINTFTHFKRCPSSIYEESDTPTSEYAHSLSSAQLPVMGDSYFAIHLIAMDVYAESLTVTNGGGHIMIFEGGELSHLLVVPPGWLLS